jgi:hypothetical protein
VFCCLIWRYAPFPNLGETISVCFEVIMKDFLSLRALRVIGLTAIGLTCFAWRQGRTSESSHKEQIPASLNGVRDIAFGMRGGLEPVQPFDFTFTADRESFSRFLTEAHAEEVPREDWHLPYTYPTSVPFRASEVHTTNMYVGTRDGGKICCAVVYDVSQRKVHGAGITGFTKEYGASGKDCLEHLFLTER